MTRLRDIAAGKVNKSEVEVVLAHYNEDLSWTSAYHSICTIYTKSDDQNPGGIKLPNLGREGHTFLHHIVTRYDTLSNWTVFSQAGSPTVGYNGHRNGGGHMLPGVHFADYIVHEGSNSGDGAFLFFTSVLHMDSLKVSNRHTFISRTGPDGPPRCPNGVAQDTWDKFESLGWFVQYLASKCNTTASRLPESFLEYWKTYVQSEIPGNHLAFYAQGARFAMSKERIRSRPKQYYQDLLNMVSTSTDPCSNYFNEWTWFYMLGVVGPEPLCALELKDHPEVGIQMPANV